jgi:hypothetical protein
VASSAAGRLYADRLSGWESKLGRLQVWGGMVQWLACRRAHTRVGGVFRARRNINRSNTEIHTQQAVIEGLLKCHSAWLELYVPLPASAADAPAEPAAEPPAPPQQTAQQRQSDEGGNCGDEDGSCSKLPEESEQSATETDSAAAAAAAATASPAAATAAAVAVAGAVKDAGFLGDAEWRAVVGRLGAAAPRLIDLVSQTLVKPAHSLGCQPQHAP